MNTKTLKEKRRLTIEAWDFWKISKHMRVLLSMAHILDFDIRLIYHAKRDQSEFFKISVLENALRQAGQPYEISILFDEHPDKHNLRLMGLGYKCY